MDAPRRHRKPGRPPTEKATLTAEELENMSLTDLIEIRSKGKLKKLPLSHFQSYFAQHRTIKDLPYEKPEELAQTLLEYRFGHIKEWPTRRVFTMYLKNHLNQVKNLPPETKKLVDDLYREELDRRKDLRNADRFRNLDKGKRMAYSARNKIAYRNIKLEAKVMSSEFASKFEYLLHELRLSEHEMTASELENSTRRFREFYGARKPGQTEYLDEMLQYLINHNYQDVDIVAAKKAREEYMRDLKLGVISEEPMSADEQDYKAVLNSDSSNDQNRGPASSGSKSINIGDRAPYPVASSDDAMPFHQDIKPSFSTEQWQSDYNDGVSELPEYFGDAIHGGNLHPYHHTASYGKSPFIQQPRGDPNHAQRLNNNPYETGTSQIDRNPGSVYANSDARPRHLVHHPQELTSPSTGFSNQWGQPQAGPSSPALNFPFLDNLDIFLTDFPDVTIQPHEMQHSSASGSFTIEGSQQPSRDTGAPHYPRYR